MQKTDICGRSSFSHPIKKHVCVWSEFHGFCFPLVSIQICQNECSCIEDNGTRLCVDFRFGGFIALTFHVVISCWFVIVNMWEWISWVSNKWNWWFCSRLWFSFMSGISELSVWSHFSMSPLVFFCLVPSLFLSYPFLIWAHSPDLFSLHLHFPKGGLFRVALVFLFCLSG